MKLNLREIGNDDRIPEGIYSIATKDLGAQYFMVRRQAPRAYFAPGQLCVYKVEVVDGYHNQIRFENAGWQIWVNESMEQMLAYKMFAFASNQGIYVWKKYQDRRYPLGNAQTISATPATLEITSQDLDAHERGENLSPDIPDTDVKLWMAYAKVLWDFIVHAPASDVSIGKRGHVICKNVTKEISGGAVKDLSDGMMRAPTKTRHTNTGRRRW